MATPKKAAVFIADGEAVARCGLAHLVASHKELRVCGEADGLTEAREQCVRLQPDIIVLDPGMSDGLAFIREMRRRCRHAHIVAFTGLEDAISVQRAYRAGVCGYVTRRDPVSAVMAAILGAVRGEKHVGPRVEHVLLDRLSHGDVDMSGAAEAALSSRELEIFHLIGRGFGTRAVAAELHVAVKTVETHRQRIKEKLGLASGTELARRAALFHGANVGG